jgi:hypothetical protein
LKAVAERHGISDEKELERLAIRSKFWITSPDRWWWPSAALVIKGSLALALGLFGGATTGSEVVQLVTLIGVYGVSLIAVVLIKPFAHNRHSVLVKGLHSGALLFLCMCLLLALLERSAPGPGGGGDAAVALSWLAALVVGAICAFTLGMIILEIVRVRQMPRRKKQTREAESKRPEVELPHSCQGAELPVENQTESQVHSQLPTADCNADGSGWNAAKAAAAQYSQSADAVTAALSPEWSKHLDPASG